MYDVLVNHEQADLLGFLAATVGLTRATDSSAIGRIVQGRIVGAVGYDNHNGSTCNMHMALESPRALNRALLWKMFEVPFVQWGYKVVLAATGSQNDSCLTLIRKLGFEHRVTIPDAHLDGSLVVFSLHKNNCRWLNIRYRHG